MQWPARMLSLLSVWGISICRDNSGRWCRGAGGNQRQRHPRWATVKPSLAKPAGPGANPLMAAIFGSVASMVT